MKKTIKLIIVLYIVVGLVAGLYLVQTDTKQNAQVETKTEKTDEQAEEVAETAVETSTVEAATEQEKQEEVAEEAPASEETAEEASEEAEEEEKIFSDEPVNIVFDDEVQHYYRFTIDGYDLNIRSGPGKEYRAITSMKSGETGYVIEAADGWSKVATGDTIGYAANSLLKTYEINKSEIPAEYFE